jgi:hypothetical protein
VSVVVRGSIKIDEDKDFMDRVSSIPPAPHGCSASIEQRPDGLAIVFPPLGWQRAGTVLRRWTICWNLLMIPLVIAFYSMAFTNGVASFSCPPIEWWLLFPLPLLLISLSSVWVLYRLGRREAVIILNAEKLKVASIEVLGTKTAEWDRGDVVDIRAGARGDEDPSIELQIRSKSGDMFRLLARRGNSELMWVASVLRKAIGLPDPQPTREELLRKRIEEFTARHPTLTTIVAVLLFAMFLAVCFSLLLW